MENDFKQLEKFISKNMDGLPDNLLKNFEKRLRDVAIKSYIEGKNISLSKLLTVDQVAERLGVSLIRARFLIRKAHEKDGIGIRFGNIWLVTEPEVDILKPSKKIGRPSNRDKAKKIEYPFGDE